MSGKVSYVKYQPKGKTKSEVPITTLWKNAPMVRIHSIKAVTREILNLADSLDVVKINIIGSPSTGKTTLAETLMHLCHELATIPFTVKKLDRNDLMKFEHTLSQLQPTNHILLFDDISFMTATAGKKRIDAIQKSFTEIRHLPGGQDVKIIAIFNFHYNMAVSKYMRQSDYFFYTSIGSSELENTQKVVGNKFTNRILHFRKIMQQALSKGSFDWELGKKGQKLNYPFRKPFAPVFFWNNDTARIVVFPKRDWIKKICGACSAAGHRDITYLDLAAFDKDVRSRFGIGIVRNALRNKLMMLGVNVLPKRVKQCMQYVDDKLALGDYDLEEMAQFYELKDNRTRLDFKPVAPEKSVIVQTTEKKSAV